MTEDEAIKRLKEQQNEFNENWVDYAGINEAYNMAIRSLEAWEKVKEDIEIALKYTKNEGICNGYNKALHFIDNHLQEVEIENR